jgi:hypothetical protein
LIALRTVPTGAAVLVTVIGPVVAPAGTVAFRRVADTWVTVVAVVPLNLTAELLLKPRPLIVTTVPTGPVFGEKLVIDSVGVKFVAPVDAVPAGVVTVIGAGTAPLGTVTFSWVALEDVTLAFLVPNVTLAPGLRPVPAIVTVLPVIPECGVNDVIVGATLNVQGLVILPTGAVVFCTLTSPVIAVFGTVACRTVAESWLTVVAATLPNLTLVELLNPKPSISTLVPVVPLVGVRLVMSTFGAATAKAVFVLSSAPGASTIVQLLVRKTLLGDCVPIAAPPTLLAV